MITNHNTVYLIALVCIFAMFITCMVYLRRRDKTAWKTLILVSGAFIVAILIAARFLVGDQTSLALFIPGLAVAAAALIGLLVATLLGPHQSTVPEGSEADRAPVPSSNIESPAPVEDTFVPVESEQSTHRADNQPVLQQDNEPPAEHDPFQADATGNLSLVEINADLVKASNDGARDDIAKSNENFIDNLRDSDNSTGATESTAKWKAPVTSLHDHRTLVTNNKTDELANDDVRTDLKNEPLDLSDSERLFQDMRNEIQGVDLPDNDQWLTDASLTHDLDLSEDQLILDGSEKASSKEGAESIVDAELIDDDEALDPDATLNFGNDLSHEYSRPESVSDDSLDSADPEIPQTLEEAVMNAKRSAADLQSQVEKLEAGIASFDALRDQQYIDASRDQLVQADSLIKRDNILQVESETLAMQDNVMGMQRKLLQKTARRQQLVSALLKQERRRLAIQQEEIEKARRMARQAAIVARKAASAQQAMQDVAKREQTARIKAQSSAKKAMDIARNAINALNARNGRSGTHY